MDRIHEVSGGNPFYAIELARAIAERAPGVETSLPRTLADVVRARLGGLDPHVHDALLAASCMAAPTVELVSTATRSDDDRLIELLENAESNGIIAIDGNRIHFAHPLLARGVYTEAAPGQRRTMHRRLADIVDEPELRARHLALAATSGDQLTLRALDTAAESARVRGAPAAAAELMDLAIGLGGDTAPPTGLRYPVQATWDGGLVVPTDDAYRFQLNAPVGTRLTIDGRDVFPARVPAGRPSTAVVALTQGPHTVHLAATLTDQRTCVELQWAQGAGPLAPISRRYLWDNHVTRS